MSRMKWERATLEGKTRHPPLRNPPTPEEETLLRKWAGIGWPKPKPKPKKKKTARPGKSR
jgi:hypothetical protein